MCNLRFTTGNGNGNFTGSENQESRAMCIKGVIQNTDIIVISMPENWKKDSWCSRTVKQMCFITEVLFSSCFSSWLLVYSTVLTLQKARKNSSDK